jgi:hypothetical protein
MTLMGKILVFLILVLAITQAALHLMFHVTQTNWKEGYAKIDKEYKLLAAEYQAAQAEEQQAKDEAAKSVQKVESDRDTLKKQLDDEKTKYQTLLAQFNAEKDKGNKGEANLQGSTTDIARRQDEVKQLEETHKADEARVKELVDSNNQLRDRAVAAEIESKSLKERNSNLVNKLEEMSKELIRTKNGTAAGGATVNAKNPPPENVEGKVTKTDSSGLLTLDIGSDDGVLKGHTLEVFRLSPSAKYLGTVRVIQVTPHEAVAQPVNRPLGPIQQGDKVASKILGS